MSLVDYASSSDDDVSEAEEEEQQQQHQQDKDEQSRNPNQEPPLNIQRSGLSSNQRKPEAAAQPSLLTPNFERLPDASVLLNSASVPTLTGTDHAARVAAAMAESSTRKRDSSGLASTLPRSKLPKGILPHSKNVLDTAGGLLVPPQLSGRSNVVTEDISKLFVRRPAAADPSSH